MDSIQSIPIELTVVLGTASLPINHLLRMGRGAVIELESNTNEQVEILANNTPIAMGEVVVQGERISISVTSKIRRSAAEA